MEVIGCSRWVNNLHIMLSKNILVVIVNTIPRNKFILITEQEIPLCSTRRVLRSLTVITMRKKHHESILDVPFSFS
jgi:hypothetical protein